jgi:hypothetical protein
LLDKLGKHKISKACLYINKLAGIDLSVLEEMLRQSFIASAKPKLSSVEEYISSVPRDARPVFDDLRKFA